MINKLLLSPVQTFTSLGRVADFEKDQKQHNYFLALAAYFFKCFFSTLS